MRISGDRDAPWLRLLSSGDRERLKRARFGRRIGFGRRPALLVIDVQNYMVGPPPGSPHTYPSACGEPAEAVIPRLATLAALARSHGVPIIYTQHRYRRDGADMGIYRLKRDLMDTEGWCLEGSEGARIHAGVAPEPGDIVLPKHKPSAFLGTPLLGLLVDRGIDTVLVTGGSTANCVRATTVDAMSYNFRPIVVEDCVFDRFELSHLAALFDLDRQYADVTSSTAVAAALQAGQAGTAG